MGEKGVFAPAAGENGETEQIATRESGRPGSTSRTEIEMLG